jgi:hypothetical protein
VVGIPFKAMNKPQRIIHTIKTWPHNKSHPVRQYWNPWWVIVWRAIWIPPTFVLTVALVSVVAIGWGKRKAEILWEDIIG